MGTVWSWKYVRIPGQCRRNCTGSQAWWKNYFKQTLETLQELDDVKVFDTYIRVDSGIEWSQDNNAPVIAYKKSSRSAKEYMELTREIAATLKG